jgi:hypothetical protein
MKETKKETVLDVAIYPQSAKMPHLGHFSKQILDLVSPMTRVRLLINVKKHFFPPRNIAFRWGFGFWLVGLKFNAHTHIFTTARMARLPKNYVESTVAIGQKAY